MDPGFLEPKRERWNYFPVRLRSLIAGFAIVKSAIVDFQNIFGGPKVFGAET